MNRKQRRAFSKQQRANKKKQRTVERKLATDYESVQKMAVVLEKVQSKVQTIQQAIQEIPAEELDTRKLIADMAVIQGELGKVRASSQTMGPAVQTAVNDAVSKITDANAELEKVLEELDGREE